MMKKVSNTLLLMLLITFGGLQAQDVSADWIKIDVRHKKNQAYLRKGNEMMRLILEGIQTQQIQPYIFSLGFDKNRKMSQKDFFAKITSRDTRKLLRVNDLAVIYVVQIKGDNGKHNIPKVSLVIPQGVSSETLLGNLFYADLDFEELSKFLETKFEENPVKYGWVNPENGQEKMSYAQALKEGKYFGNVDKSMVWR